MTMITTTTPTSTTSQLPALAEAGTRAVVRAVIRETHDTKSFVLGTSRRLRYLAGQHVTVTAPLAEGAQRRCYSFSSAPGVDDLPVITVKQVRSGRVSSWLHSQIAEGSELELSAPTGSFVLSDDDARPLLLLGAGSGITPLMSLLKSALHGGRRQVRLFYANRDAASTIFLRQLERIAGHFPTRLTVRHVRDAEHGHPTEQRIGAQLAGMEDADVYLCGPAPFMALSERVVRARIPDDRVYVERFGPKEPSASSLAGPAEATAQSAPSAVTWLLDGCEHTFACHAGDTLLQAARRAGLSPPSSCEEGYCGACATRLVEGEVQMRGCDGLSRDKRAQGWILPCQALVTSRKVHLQR